MTTTSSGKCLVLLAHPDDEIFMLPFLLNKQLNPTFIYFSENSRFFSADRSTELQNAFKRFQKNGFNFQLKSIPNNCRDGFCFSDLTQDHYFFVEQVVKDLGNPTIVTLSLEGGHQDHDVINLFSRKIALSHKLPFIQFPSYRKSNNVLLPFSVMRSQQKGSPFIFGRIMVVKEMCNLAFIYKSQWRTWIGLLPFLFYRYTFLSFCEELSEMQIDEDYECLYESRGHAKKSDVVTSVRWLLS